MRLIFPSASHLRNKADIDAVFANRNKYVFRHFILYSRLSAHPSARIAILVAKKKIKSAVGRNTVRLIVKESFRHARSTLPNADIVIVYRSKSPKLEKAELRKCIDQLFANYRECQNKSH